MRQRLVVFHEDSAVFSRTAVAAPFWRVLRACSLEELSRRVSRLRPEIVVTDAQAHGVTLAEVFDLLDAHGSVARLLLWPSRPADPAAFAKSLLDNSRRVGIALHFRDSRSPAKDDALIRETLFSLRLAPYAHEIVQACTVRLGLGRTPFEPLPSLFAESPWSYRKPRDLAFALKTTKERLFEAARGLGYTSTQELLFRVRVEMSIELVSIGTYSWPECRETFGEPDHSNFRRRAARWLEPDPVNVRAGAPPSVPRDRVGKGVSECAGVSTRTRFVSTQ